MNFYQKQEVECAISLIEEKLQNIPHIWCSNISEGTKTLLLISNLVRKDNLILANNIEIDKESTRIMKNEEGKWEFEENDSYIKHLYKPMKKMLEEGVIRSLGACLKCKKSFYEMKLEFLNDQNGDFFDKLDKHRIFEDLCDSKSLIGVIEILNFNWNVVLHKNIRKKFFERMLVLKEKEMYQNNISFSLLLCLLCDDSEFCSFIMRNLSILYRKNKFYLHTKEDEWSYATKLYELLLENSRSNFYTCETFLNFLLIYLSIEGTYCNDELVSLILRHFEQINSDAEMFLLYKISTLFCEKVGLNDDLKPVYADIFNNEKFLSLCKIKNFSVDKEGFVCDRSDIHYIFSSFFIFIEFGLEIEIFSFFNEINDLYYLRKYFEKILVYANKIVNWKFFIKNNKHILYFLIFLFIQNENATELSKNKSSYILNKMIDLTVESIHASINITSRNITNKASRTYDNNIDIDESKKSIYANEKIDDCNDINEGKKSIYARDNDNDENKKTVYADEYKNRKTVYADEYKNKKPFMQMKNLIIIIMIKIEKLFMQMMIKIEKLFMQMMIRIEKLFMQMKNLINIIMIKIEKLFMQMMIKIEKLFMQMNIKIKKRIMQKALTVQTVLIEKLLLPHNFRVFRIV
ncbi:hypothetical protein EDEG_03393 [Edhazardia aedis USNM 41457]|uniref:Uncharacterized protein n=1 Tax=Edhazardia aedis (strain USNM 41457) TaxID=1003232 RepID=J9D3P8_EDHAE|nr:hypothetical protein EDEG_03393 [Edhazardia aedis USNM 41457]|eukprot:EJW02164.1 hypothetical protein EDEG_03393 [Edhazardia aedis USNM 41457]